ncbi:MAG: bifunctional [glutamine synthetase] adenylyltransferase/[glutamine synthetase]-adenylyl-L-tyrosine phosphorylase [Xanthobacteraceae bacterium]
MKRRAAAKRPRQTRNQAGLAHRFGAMLPKPTAEASARVAAWLASVRPKSGSKALTTLIRRNPALARVLGGIAEAAPYLWNAIEAKPARLLRLLGADPAHSLAALVQKTKVAAAGARSQLELMRILREFKLETALLIALADIGGVWALPRITEALTRVADIAVVLTIDHLLKDAVRQKKIKSVDLNNPQSGCGYIVLAMGKMGAGELNFSSDIDLMVFFDAGVSFADDIEPAPFFIGLTRDLIKILQTRTSDGYVFRVDFRLRPDPSSTQIAISTAAALDYYESRGQNWERAALIKARACAGDIAIGEQFLRDLSPFIWRKYLDYAAIADVHEMKQQIHAYRGHGEIAVEGHNIKLGRGGIREIEFFVQTQQLIAGGRHTELRDRGTVVTLSALTADGWIDEQARDELAAAYDFLRTVEHRLQMMTDEQIHTLPATPEALDVFARFLGYPSRDEFADVLVGNLRKVERHYVRLFERAPALLAQQQKLSFEPFERDGELFERLTQMGFRRAPEIVDAVRNWRSGVYRAVRGEQARENLVNLTPVILDQLSRAENPDASFAAFDRFLAGLRAGGRLFSLLRQNPELVRFVALIIGAAPRLADILAHHPHFIDPLVDPGFFGALPDEARLRDNLESSLTDTSGFEAMLDAIRLFGQEHMFLIGARIISGSLSAQQAGETFARLADVLLNVVHRWVQTEFAKTHGYISGGESAVLALGRLGAREMTASSDLDLIVVYDFDQEHPQSDGKRPLHGSQYFARLTQRMIGALTVQTNYGVLYPVDMRLRPSGRSGPVATQIDGFKHYQEHEAWTWEHMALTRARVVSGTPDFSARVEAVIRKVLCRPRDMPAIARDVVDMRGAIAKEKGDADPWELKYAAGGLIDIEFIAQYLQLAHAAKLPEMLDTSTVRTLEKAERLGVLAPQDAAVLRLAVRLFHDLTQILRLCLPASFDPQAASPGILALLARAADLPDFPTLSAHLTDTQRAVRASFIRILGGAP